VSAREVVVLGTASQSPTRHRNHNGYLLLWDGEGILFDPGEGTQRQFTLADVSPATVTRICISHFHGDHCLGLPGMIMRLALDANPEHGRVPVPIHYPASGQSYFDRLRYATAGQELIDVDAQPVAEPGIVHTGEMFTLRCARLEHRIEALGYRLQEPDGRRMLPARLDALGVAGADIGRLREAGRIDVDGRAVTLAEVSEHRPGQSFAFVMDTAWCDAALDLAAGVDLLVCESTFLSSEEHLAAKWGHLTARQAGRLAAEAGARQLVLCHFSRRYPDVQAFADEAGAEFGDVIIAEDLGRIPVPSRRI
jgi:ribonuclease Z